LHNFDLKNGSTTPEGLKTLGKMHFLLYFAKEPLDGGDLHN
jgi:hypothetical protein